MWVQVVDGESVKPARAEGVVSRNETRRWAKFSELVRHRIAQRKAELARLPTLLGRVIPELARDRLFGTESFVDRLTARAKSSPSLPALLFEQERITFAELDRRVGRLAAWLFDRGIRSGDVVALWGPSTAGYVTALLASSRLGATVALLGAELGGSFLETTLVRVAPRAVLVEDGTGLAASVPESFEALEFDAGTVPRDSALDAVALEAGRGERTGTDDFVYVYTSGTTGPTKAARITHRRSLLAATAFGRLVHRTRPGDVIYSALPLHHASALLFGLGVSLVTGAALALRSRFSASAFWSDVRRFEATVMLYIGELPHALLAQSPTPDERTHSLRLAVGNGLRPELWRPFRERFGIPEVHEFYAATEFPGAIVNLTGTDGSVGHIPLERTRGYRLVRVDVATGQLVRTGRGRAIECEADEPGELVLRLKPAPGSATGDYDGYIGETGGGSRIAGDLFRAGDLYCRSGDLLRRDRAGNFWFVDRLGDSFRFKGQNVSSREVETFLGACAGVNAVAVVGLRGTGIDGQPPLAILSVTGSFDVAAFEHAVTALPAHARPCFVRVVHEFAMTESMKVKKRALAQEGVDPARVSDTLLFRSGDRYEPLTVAVYERFLAGALRF
jgi:fatty-acyl-CoA synthase